MRPSARRLYSKGDTIVEVLIAIAIVASVLIGAFTVTQKSAQAVRDSQERSQVLQLLQGQVELVRALALQATDTTMTPYVGTQPYFCIDPANSSVRQDFTDNQPPAADYSNYNNACKNLGPGHFYHIADTYDTSSKVFSFEGHWDSIQGGQDSAILYYKIFPGNPPPPAPAAAMVLPPLSIVPLTCTTLQTTPGIDGFKSFVGYNGKDWHVNNLVLSPAKPAHPISSTSYTFPAPLQPGIYQIWGAATDGTPAVGQNQKLHYIGYASDGTTKTFQTADTPELNTAFVPARGIETGTVTVTDVTTTMKVEHASPDPSLSPQPTDDGVDAYCIAYRKLN